MGFMPGVLYRQKPRGQTSRVVTGNNAVNRNEILSCGLVEPESIPVMCQ